jgi:Tfp pilus assembly protein PilF
MSKKNLQPKKNIETSVKTSKTKTISPDFWWIAGILALAFVAFLPVLDHEFVNWDDPLNITENPQLQVLSFKNFIDIFTHNIIGGYNPLSIVTFFIEKMLFGNENLSRVIHVDNLLLHLATTYFVWKLAKQMGISIWASAMIALLFAVHPMRVESVAWATERKDVLFGVFYFAGLLHYVNFLQSGERKYAIWVFVLFVLSLFSKVQAVSFPLSLLALDYWLGRKMEWKRIIEKWHFWLGSLAMGAATVALLKMTKTIGGETSLHFSFVERLLIASQSFCVYIAKMFYPYAMAALYPYPAQISGWSFWLAPLGVLAAFGLGIWAFRRGNRALVFGLAFFFVNFIFVSQIIGAGQGYLADRFTYVGYFGGFVSVVLLLEQAFILGGGYFLKIGMGLYVCFCVITTYNQSLTWRNPETLWTNALAYQSSITPYLNRGLYLREKKQFPKALEDFKKAIALQPSAGLYNSLGKTYFDMHNNEGAIENYEKALKMDTLKADIWINLASLKGKLGKMDEALELVNKGLAIESDNKEGFLTRSLIHQTLGKYAEALKDDEQYLKINPQNSEIWFESANLRTAIGEQNDAVLNDLSQAISLSKKVEYFEKRAALYTKMGNTAAARQDYEQIRLLRRK